MAAQGESNGSKRFFPALTVVRSDGGPASSSSNVGAIAGGVAGGVVALLALGALLFFLLRRRRRQQRGNGSHDGRGGSYSPVRPGDKSAGSAGDDVEKAPQRGHHRRNTFTSGVDLLAGASTGHRRSSDGHLSSSDPHDAGPSSPTAFEPSPYFVRGGGDLDSSAPSTPPRGFKSIRDPSDVATDRPSTESSNGTFSGRAGVAAARPTSFGSGSDADTWAEFANRWGASGGGMAAATAGPLRATSSLDSSPVLPIASRFSSQQLATQSPGSSPWAAAGGMVPAPAPPVTAHVAAAATASPGRSNSTRKAPLRVANPSVTQPPPSAGVNDDQAPASSVSRGATRFVLHEDAGEIQAIGPDPDGDADAGVDGEDRVV